MKKFETHIEDAEVSCVFVSGNPCCPDESEVDIKVCNRIYRIYTLVGPFESDEATGEFTQNGRMAITTK